MRQYRCGASCSAYLKVKMMTRYEQCLTELLAELVGEPRQFSLTETFLDQGIDSFLALRLVRGIEDRLGVTVDLESLYDYPSIEQLAKFIEEQAVNVNL